MACSCQKHNDNIGGLPPTKEEVINFIKDSTLATGGFIAGQMLRQKVDFIKEKALVSGGIKTGLSVGLGLATEMRELRSAAVGLFMSGLYDLSEAADGKKGGPIQKTWGIAGLDNFEYRSQYAPYANIANNEKHNGNGNKAVIE